MATLTAPLPPRRHRRPPRHPTRAADDAASLVLERALSAATTYYTSPQGDDAAAGTDATQSFATIQRGVDALEAGDTLIILAGEYHEAIERKDLGNEDTVTTIKAAIAGTAVIRGDVTAGFMSEDQRRASPGHFAVWGIVLNQANGCTIRNCLSYRSRGYGIRLYGNSSGEAAIENCIGWGNAADFFVKGANVRKYTVVRNTVAQGLGHAVNTESSYIGAQNIYQKPADAPDDTIRRPDDERKLFWIMSFEEDGKTLGHTRMSIADYNRRVHPTNSLVADPGFPAMEGVDLGDGFLGDAIIRQQPLDFERLFTTNPELVKRKIGLDPSQFRD